MLDNGNTLLAAVLLVKSLKSLLAISCFKQVLFSFFLINMS